jgi:hypothetical protein
MRNFMALRQPLSAILPCLVGSVLLFSTALMAQDTVDAAVQLGDPVKGKTVYQRVGGCVSCHGWAGDGQAGINPLARSVGANLRKSKLETETLTEVIRCGRPGTGMPYHDSAAYRDGDCYGLVLADLVDDTKVVRGKTFRSKQLADLVAYLEANVVGRGKPTLEECQIYYEASADKACSYLQSD